MNGARAIRSWLITVPRPAFCRVTDASEAQHEVTLGPATNWARAAETIEALEPVRLEALDEKKGLIRATKYDPSGEEETDDGHTVPAAPRFAMPPLPASSDPETVRLITFAGLIADAYRHSTEVAFARMVDVFQSCNARAETAERMAHETMAMLREAWLENVETRAQAIDAVNEANEAAASAGGGEPGDLITDIAKAFVGGADLGGKQASAPTPPATPPGKTNGHTRGQV